MLRNSNQFLPPFLYFSLLEFLIVNQNKYNADKKVLQSGFKPLYTSLSVDQNGHALTLPPPPPNEWFALKKEQQLL